MATFKIARALLDSSAARKIEESYVETFGEGGRNYRIYRAAKKGLEEEQDKKKKRR